MTFIPLNKTQLSILLEEKRAGDTFRQPDLFISFTNIIRIFIHEDVVSRLELKWKSNLTLWDGELDFRESQSSDDNQFCCTNYLFVDFGIIPKQSSLTAEESKYTPFAWNGDYIFINKAFVLALKQSGANYIWYDFF